MERSDARLPWQSPLDESTADLPVDLTLDVLDKYKYGKELTDEEHCLVLAALAERPDLVSRAGIVQGGLE